ncbi:MAG: hypothetical protein WCE38_00280, partial [Burkholderiales bacterium]
CDVSFQAPVGMLDVDGTFSFVVGNFCPDLFVLNCLDSAPQEVQILPPPNPPIAATQCEVRYRDGDDTCGQSCDPQSCVTTPEGLTCTPGPDPGVSTTVTCTDLFLDCNGDGSPDPSCTWQGDATGAVGLPPAQFPGPPGQGNFFVTCIPPALGGNPGATGQCTAVTTDGDLDCNKTKVVDITCPGLNPCNTPGVCSDSNDCTADQCTNNAGTAVCANPNLPSGTACVAVGGGLCDGNGNCIAQGCTSDSQCDTDGNECTAAAVGSCNIGTGQCELPPVNVPNGTACDSNDGTCQSGTCVDNCTGVSCSDGNPCTLDVCTPTGGATCSNPAGNDGAACTTGGNPGQCSGGACVAPAIIPAASGSTTWSANTTPAGSNGGVTTTGGGCAVFVTALNTTIFLQVDITLNAVSNGANQIDTGWTITATHYLLPTLGNAAELGGLAVAAVVTGATPTNIPSALTAAATGQIIGAFIVGNTLTLATPAQITAGSQAMSTTHGANVTVNWDGTFALTLTLGGNPLVVVDESVCTFDEAGAPAINVNVP